MNNKTEKQAAGSNTNGQTIAAPQVIQLENYQNLMRKIIKDRFARLHGN